MHNEWGGPASAAKAGKLLGEIMELFRSPERIYKDVSRAIIFSFIFCMILFVFSVSTGRVPCFRGFLGD